MVYVYAKQSEINKYVGSELTVDEIKETLVDMGMDIKGEEGEKNPELKIEITAEKLDLVSAVGIGRAIKYYRKLETKLPKYEIVDSKLKLNVKSSAAKSRPKTVAALIKNFPMNQEFLNEIIQLQEKIHDSFGRGRKKAAIGIYPSDKIKFPITYGSEEPKKIIYQPLGHGRKMNANDILRYHDTGKKYKHLLDGYKLYPVFRDFEKKVLSMPPIVNSQEMGKVELEHKNLFIECSGFNLTHLDNILKVIVTTLVEMGGKAESIDVVYESSGEVYKLDLSSQEDVISLDYINSLIGTNIKFEEAEVYFNQFGYNVLEMDKNKDVIKFEIPCFRSDVWHDADVADDIARAYGYNNIVPTFPSISSIGSHLTKTQFKESFSNVLVALGCLETYTYILTSTQVQFSKMNLNEEDYSYIRLTDSEDQGLNMARIKILPESLTTLHINRKNKYPQKIFENGFTIQEDNSADTKAINENHLCVCLADPKANYTQIKGILDTLFKLHEIDFSTKEEKIEYLIDGRRASIFVKGESVGFIGELHPQILTNFGLIVPISVLEVNLDKIFELTQISK